MSTDLDLRTAVNPRTGEVLSLDAPTSDLGAWLADLRDHEQLVRDMKALVTGEVLARMDRQGLWTLEDVETGIRLRGASPAPVEEFDAPALRDALLELVDEGVLEAAAVDRAIEVVVEYKPRKAGLAALRKLGGRVAAAVDAHARQVEKRRYVNVERRA